MKPVFMFDVYKTLVDCPGWETYLAQTPALKQLEQDWLRDRAQYQEAYMRAFDVAVEQGKCNVYAYEEVRLVLGHFYNRGAIGVYSSGSKKCIFQMLESAGIKDLFSNTELILSLDDLRVGAKDTPEAFQTLHRYLAAHSFEMKSYVDDSEKIVKAVVRSGAAIERVYQVNRSHVGTGLQKEGYSVISSLDQMRR
jgi:hypothetical protein